MKIWKIAPVAALVATAFTPSVAQAHFIWATIENGQVRFALLENPSEKPDAKFGKYVENLQSKLALGSVSDGARSCALPTGAASVFAETMVGVKNREGVEYLLLYHARAAASLESAEKPARASFEVLASRAGGELVASVRQGGWPVPDTEVTLHIPGSDEQKTATTDLKGEVRFAFPQTVQAGFVGLRAKVVEEKPGAMEGKKYAEVHHWTTLTFPLAPATQAVEPISKVLRASFGANHDIVGGAAFNATLFHGTLTRHQAEVHLQQRALVHNEAHRILNAADSALGVPYGAAQKNVLVLLFNDLISMGSGWPTEAQARPLTRIFLQELRESEKSGPFFALGVQHVYYGGITNGGRMIGKKMEACVGFSPSYYAKSDGYRDYLGEVNKIVNIDARAEMLRGGQAAYKYIIASSNEDVFKMGVSQ